jgi:catechol 2,3-dioxygenase-like lactoylglutathione lyase family enzyme
MPNVTISRAVPNITSDRTTETRDFFVNVLGFEVAMDLGWVVTIASPANPSVQVTIIGNDDMAAPGISVGVDDVDAAHAKAVEQGAEIVYPSATRTGGSGGSCSASRAARSSTSCPTTPTERAPRRSDDAHRVPRASLTFTVGTRPARCPFGHTPTCYDSADGELGYSLRVER